MRKELPVAVSFLCGAIILLSFFTKSPAVSFLSKQVLGWRVIVAAFALGLGSINLLRVSFQKIRRKDGGVLGPIALVVSLIGYTILGIAQGTSSRPYSFIFQNIYSPATSTVFSLNAFFIVSAAYRSFRARNWQAAVFLLAGMVVLMGRVGIGQAIWGGFPVLTDWIMNNVNGAAMRGIIIGSAIGVIGTSLRVLSGAERAYFGGNE